MNKKHFIFLILIILGFSLLVGSVSAATTTYTKGYCHGGDENHITTWYKKGPVEKAYMGVVKKNNKYYKLYYYVYEYGINKCTHKSHAAQLKIWGEKYYSYSSRSGDYDHPKYVKTSKPKPKVKTLTIYDYNINNFYSKYIGISKGKSYKNGVITGKNPMNGKYQKAPVYAHKTKIYAKNGAKIKKIVATSIGYPSGKIYKTTYYFSKSKTLTPSKYKGFWKYTIYYYT